MLGRKPQFLPIEDVRAYKSICLVLYIAFIILLVYGVMSFLFPYTRYFFDFSNPDALKNTLFFPHAKSFSSIENGKVVANDTLILYGNNWHVLESGNIKIRPSKKSENSSSLQGKKIILNHGIAATFSPRSETAADIPDKTIVRYQENYYELRDDTLFPFVSKNAALSHIPENLVRDLATADFEKFSKSDELTGFRAGTFLAYADGVFVVSPDNTIRPFGSPEILTRFGFTFDHVLPANAEEVGIYKRGRIILTGQLHPSGTVFKEVDTEKLFLYEDGKLSELTKVYGDFLKEHNDVVLFSEKENDYFTTCTLTKEFLRNSYACEVTIDFSQTFGDDYQVTLDNTDGKDLDIATVTVGFQPSRKKENARFVAVLLANRVLERFGIERE